MIEGLNKKVVFSYDDEARVWIAQVQGVDVLEGIILEDSSFVTLAHRMEVAIKDMEELLGLCGDMFPL